jgi:heme/copper-type cytochrome/quinol oxidase subunit 2
MTENMPELPSPEMTAAQRVSLRKQRWLMVGVITLVVVVMALLGWALIALSRNPAAAANVRDIFIILMALESLVVGTALVVLIIQLATLINLLQNEVRPILKSTNETVNTLRGTSEFLSENLVEPVIKLNSYLAGLKRLFDLFGINHK